MIRRGRQRNGVAMLRDCDGNPTPSSGCSSRGDSRAYPFALIPRQQGGDGLSTSSSDGTRNPESISPDSERARRDQDARTPPRYVKPQGDENEVHGVRMSLLRQSEPTRAPTPYELLLGSVAACTATTWGSTNHKRIPLAGVGIRLTFNRVHADDCMNCDVRTYGWTERIQSSVTTRGRFDAAQRKRLGRVARRCPVHKTLTNGVEIMDSVVPRPVRRWASGLAKGWPACSRSGPE